MKGVPLDRGGINISMSSSIDGGGGIPRKRPKPAVGDGDDDKKDEREHKRPSLAQSSSSRKPSASLRKRDRKTPSSSHGDDLEDTDSDASEDESYRTHRSTKSPSPTPSSLSKKRIKKKVSRQDDFAKQEDVDEILDEVIEDPIPGKGGTGGDGIDSNQVEAPPPGVLGSLWYSRECVLHVFVIEKILGWKTRPMVSVKYLDGSDQATPAGATAAEQRTSKHRSGLPDPAKAAKLSANITTDSITDARKRMEVSRINPSQCPVVAKVSAQKEELRAKSEDTPPRYEAQTSDTEREEVLLVKWRGRSHLHCSWERRRDLEKFDSTNTARNKMRRYVQSQEVTFGKNWQEQLDEGRRTTHRQIHSHGSHAKIEAREDENAPTEEEELFPIDHTEVERIMACDESQMDMGVFARQRAHNTRAEAEALRAIEENGDSAAAAALLGTDFASPADSAMVPTNKPVPVPAEKPLPSDDDSHWDPEDYVRYVIKWKGLPCAEVTWEYWKDIKHDFVNQAEDFWRRQMSAPSLDDVKIMASRPHPHMRDFKKLNESPVFGVSKAKRSVADLNGDGSVSSKAQSTSGDDDLMEAPALRLRGYQLEGVNWLLWNWWNKRSCILADEMGLGKTIQSVGFLDQLSHQSATSVRGPFLIVAPLSLVSQWQSESTMWAPDMNVILYHGSADARDFIAKQEFYYSDQFMPKATASKLKRQHITKFHILITTYEVVLKDVAVLSRIKWKALIVDEAHRLKNAKSRLFDDLASVPREFCLLLTGTPLQNSTEELWALLHFADPVQFESKETFVEKFGQLTDAQQVSDLHSVLRPYLLRRVKEDVEKSLPPKEETLVEVSLTPIQKAFYKAIYERNTAFLFKGAKPSNAPSLMNVMMELRKCCNHPFLIRGAEERILNDAAAALKKTEGGSSGDVAASVAKHEPAAADGSSAAVDSPKDPLKPELGTQDKNDQGDSDDAEHDDGVDWHALAASHLVNSSGKMVLLSKLLPKLYAGGHKVLIFSQMVRVLDLLEDFLRQRRYTFERLDGSKSASSRSSAVDRFNRKSCQRFVMLLSTRAGGLGLNLTSADTVIIFDSDWNPQNDLQAMARAHRIGQTRKVSIYRLLTAKTYEMHMFHSASMKLGLDRAVLAHQRGQNAEEGDESGPSKSKKHKSKSEKEKQAKEIDQLLKKGAYDVFRDDDDKEAKQFMETDIDQILENSSRTVTYDNTASNKISSGLGSFSKASFVADTGDEQKDVDLDDPNFWEKAVGLDAPPEELGEDEANILYGEKKRNRKQVQVFDPYAEFVEEEEAREKAKEKQRKDKIQFEKDEKERAKKEKKAKREEDREKKQREKIAKKDELQRSKEEKLKAKKEAAEAKEETLKKKQEQKKKDKLKAATAKVSDKEKTTKVKEKSSKPKTKDPISKPAKKKLKKAERKRAAKRAVREDPPLERIKQAWEVPQRNRATAAALRFGFGRLCKVRHEANLTSLPVQDVELFVRAYCYQLGAQAAVCLMKQLCNKNGETSDDHGGDIASFLMRGTGTVYRVSECVFIVQAIETALQMKEEVESRRRILRIPLILTEQSYISELRSGGALRALRRLSFLSRLNTLVDECLDGILADLGHEELGKRGCSIKDLSTLDIDLKARHVSTEELSQGLGTRLGDDYCSMSSLARQTSYSGALSILPPWWDRNCDLGLLVGTFIHGLGNYEAMRNDEELPFGRRIAEYAVADPGSAQSFRSFIAATKAIRNLYDDALKYGKIKAQVEAHEAVAKALAAAAQSKSKPKNDKGKEKNKASQVKSEDSVEKKPHGDAIQAEPKPAECAAEGSKQSPDNATKKTDNAGEGAKTKLDDSDLVTLHRLSNATGNSIALVDGSATDPSKNKDTPLYQGLPMPNARYLDHLLLNLVDGATESESAGHAQSQRLTAPSPCVPTDQNGLAPFVETIASNSAAAKKAYALCVMESSSSAASSSSGSVKDESFRGTKCGTQHRSLADGSDYNSAAASSDLASLPFGADASRYNRGKWVPLLVTRYGLGALLYADKNVLDAMVRDEHAVKAKEVPESSDAPSQDGSSAAGDDSPPAADSKPAEEEAKETEPTNPAGKKLSGLLLHVPITLLYNAQLRASVCAVILAYGLPISFRGKFWQEVQGGIVTGNITSSFLPMSTILAAIGKMSGIGIAAPMEEKDVVTYIDKVIIPHCVRLCLYEPGVKVDKKTKAAAPGNESALLWETTKPGRSGLKTPLPDPCIPLKYHGKEAIANAFAILRRVRLSRAVQFVVGGGVQRKSVLAYLQSPVMRGGMDGLPLWWCPWVHDVAILVHAAAHGLFAIIQDRNDESKLRKMGSVFERNTLERYIGTVFVEGMEGRSPALPRCFLNKSTAVELDIWVKAQARQFPSAHVLERRMALISAEMTKDMVTAANATGSSGSSEVSCVYQNFPMFDHGGWPTNG